MMNVFKCSVAMVAAGLLAVTAQAGPVQIIDDRSFFDNIPHTQIDFDTRRDRLPWPDPSMGDLFAFPPNEYFGLGLEISSSNLVLATRSPMTGPIPAALAAAGSLPFSILTLSTEPGYLRFDFENPIRSFGITTLNVLGVSTGPVYLEVFDANGELLSTVYFEGSLIDGIVLGEPFGANVDVAYGFIGLAMDRPFTSVVIHESNARFDDLHFSVVPEPATWLGLGLIAAFCASRRPLLLSPA